MGVVNLTVDVHCNINYLLMREFLSEEYTNIIEGDSPGIGYRLYINNTMLIERNWFWGNSSLIRENVPVELTSNTIHQIYIQPIRKAEIDATFTIANLTVDCPFTSEQINDLTISFKMQ